MTGKDAIRGFVAQSFKIPGFGLRWETGQVTVAPHGDMAYALAKTTTTVTGPDGKPLALRGKAATVWRKTAGGEWKCVLDIWNDDAPRNPEPAQAARAPGLGRIVSSVFRMPSSYEVFFTGPRSRWSAESSRTTGEVCR